MTLEEQRTRTRQFQTEVSMLTTRLRNFWEKIPVEHYGWSTLSSAVTALDQAQEFLKGESRNLTKLINDEFKTKSEQP